MLIIMFTHHSGGGGGGWEGGGEGGIGMVSHVYTLHNIKTGQNISALWAFISWTKNIHEQLNSNFYKHCDKFMNTYKYVQLYIYSTKQPFLVLTTFINAINKYGHSTGNDAQIEVSIGGVCT